MKHLLTAFIMSVFLAACVSAPYQLSSTPTPDDYEELGQAECGSCAFVLFDVIPISHAGNVQDAYTCAVKAKDGDDLARPVVKTKWYWTPVGLVLCIDVAGEVIKKR